MKDVSERFYQWRHYGDGHAVYLSSRYPDRRSARESFESFVASIAHGPAKPGASIALLSFEDGEEHLCETALVTQEWESYCVAEKSRQCPADKCQHFNDAEAFYCSQCGTPLFTETCDPESITCGKCDSIIDWRGCRTFCTECGRKHTEKDIDAALELDDEDEDDDDDPIDW